MYHNSNTADASEEPCMASCSFGQTQSYTNCCVTPESCTGGQTSRKMPNVLRSSKLSATPQNLGTGFGNKVAHSVATTTFIPATAEPVTVAIIYYDDLSCLRARGIKISEKKKI